MRCALRHIIFCGLPDSTLLFYIISQTARIFEKSYWIWNACFDFIYKFYVKHFSLQEELSEIDKKMYIRSHVKYPLFLSDFKETWNFSTDFRKILKDQI